MRLDHQRYNQEYLANANGAVSNNAEAYAVCVESADVNPGETYRTKPRPQVSYGIQSSINGWPL
jgi:hypothetical protein